MNILALKLKRIGDLILTVPALAALRKTFPRSRLTLGLMENSEGLLPALPMVDEALVVHPGRLNFRLLHRLATGRFDVCLDFTGNDRSAFFSALSRAPLRLTFGWVRRRWHRALPFHQFSPSNVRTTHTIDHHLDLLAPLGIERPDGSEPPGIPLCLPASADFAATKLLEQWSFPRRFAVIHPGAARQEKWWEPERWAAVIDHCQGELNLPCLITGSLHPWEQLHLQAIRARVRTAWRDVSAVSQSFGLLGLAALIRRAALLLSVDSAPMHLGAAFCTPQIALFGATNPAVWRPRHAHAVVLLAGEPGPLTGFDPYAPARFLRELPTEAVLGAIPCVLQTGSCQNKEGW